jgi:hypothetical protein
VLAHAEQQAISGFSGVFQKLEKIHDVVPRLGVVCRMTGRSNALALPFLDVGKQPRYSLAARESDCFRELALIHQQVNGCRT